jgi:iron complex outermembrane receptor protein
MKQLVCSILWIITVLPAYSQFTGQITDNSSRPLPGASVYLLNTQFAAITDAEGRFAIVRVPAGEYTVQVSAVGYATVTQSFTINTATEVLNMSLAPVTSQLDAVLVTSRKKDELLQAVPVGITALNAAQVQHYRLWNSRDITAISPNLYAASPGDNRNVISIRGITSTSYDPAVATYIDGVNQFGLDTYIAQLYDIERIEVLRGPQATLYGRNAMGGVINIITRQPTNTLQAFGEVSLGNYNQQRYAIGIRGALVKDKLYAGFSGLYDSRHGYYTNDFNNTDFDRQHNRSANAYLKYVVNPKWSVTLNAKYAGNRNKGTFPLVNGVEEALNNPFHLSQNAVTGMIDNTFNTSLSVQHTGRHINFSFQTAYQSNHRYYTDPIDGDFAPIDGVTIINNYGDDWNKVSVWTQELKFSSPAVSSSPFSWTTGAYGFIQDNPVKQATRFGEDADMLGSPDKNFSIINTTKGKSYGVAAYGQLTYSYGKLLDMTAGLRYDYEHKEQEVLSQYQHDPDPDPQFDLVPDTSANVHFGAFSPTVSLIAHASPNFHVFGTASYGYRAGGLTQVGADPSAPPLHAYKPEHSSTVTAGIKSTAFNNRLRINFSIFSSGINDVQVPTLVLPDAITVTRNAGDVIITGTELEIAATPLKGLQAEYAFGYTRARYKKLKLSQNGTEVDLSGNRQLFTPDVTSMLALQYSYPLSSKGMMKLVVRGEWTYIGKQYFDLANQIAQKGYSLLNTRFGLSSTHVDIMGWVRNAGDKKYLAYAYDFGAVHLGDPLTFGVTLTARL